MTILTRFIIYRRKTVRVPMHSHILYSESDFTHSFVSSISNKRLIHQKFLRKAYHKINPLILMRW